MNKDDILIKCKHCPGTWFTKNVQSSTSNLRTHVIKQHCDKLSAADYEYLTTTGQSSDKKTPQMALLRKFVENAPFTPRSRLKSPDRLLTKFIVNSSSSMRILDDTDLGNFLKSLNSKYTLPSRGYLETNVLEPMYYETKQVVKNLLDKCKNIGLTADAWSSLNHKSYITITGHFVDDAGDINVVFLILEKL